MDRHKVLVEYSANVAPYASQSRALRLEIEKLNAAIVASKSASSASLAASSQAFGQDLRAMKNWSTAAVSMDSTAVQLGKSIDRNQLSMAKQTKLLKEYRANAVGARGAISELAKEQVRMSRSVVNMYDDANGNKMARVSTPRGINFKDAGTQMAVARQEMQVYNRLLAQNAEATINWGKNTQWAGRQIMVGLTVPILMLGAAAKNVFIDMDKELTRLGKVYGAGLTGASDQAIKTIKKETMGLSKELAASWGVSAKETLALAADVAATGKEGNDLLVSTKEAMRLSVLGEVDRQTAMQATLSLQNAFKISNQDLAGSIDFLNAVENQTSTSLEDLAIAIPKAGPVVRSLGGDVKDLSLLMVAMKEGGINAAEGANALKSGLASMINPSKKASEFAGQLGIDLQGIVESNRGELIPTLMEFQKALQGLDDFSRAQLIEKIFGKYQFARISALFDNLNKEGSQTKQVLELMAADSSQLAANSAREMTRLTESVSMKWQRTVESFKANLAPIGEAITKVFTVALSWINKFMELVNGLPDPLKAFLGTLVGLSAIAGPLLMIAGIFGNFIGQLKKGYAFLRGKKFGAFDLLTQEMVAANAATNHLVDSQFNEVNALNEINAVMEKQILLLQELATAQRMAATGPVPGASPGNIPGMLPPPGAVRPGLASYLPSEDYGKMMAPAGGASRTGLESAWITKNRDLSAAVVGATPDTNPQKALMTSFSSESAKASNEVGRATASIVARQLAETGKVDPDSVYKELKTLTKDSSADHKRMAKVAAVTLHTMLDIDPTDPEVKKAMSEIPYTSRKGTGNARRAALMGFVAAGGEPVKIEGNIASAHGVPHADTVAMGRHAADVTTPIQGFSPTEINEHDKAKRMSHQAVGESMASAGPAILGVNDAMMRAAEAGTLEAATRANKTPGVGKVIAGLDPAQREAFEQWKAQNAESRISLQALSDQLNKLGADAHAAQVGVADLEAELVSSAETEKQEAKRAANESVKAAKEELKQAKAHNTSLYQTAKAQEAATAASKAATSQAKAASTRLTNSGATTGATASKIAQQVALGTKDGMDRALSTINTRMNALSTRTSPAAEAEKKALTAAATKIQAASDAMRASTDLGKRVSTEQLKAAQAQVEAATRNVTASKAALTAADKMVIAANTEVAAGEVEMAAANTMVGKGRTSFGAMQRSGDTAVKEPKATGRMSNFLEKTGAAPMAVGMGAMGVGMLTGNEDANKLGMMLTAVGMVGMALGPMTVAVKAAGASMTRFAARANTASTMMLSGLRGGGIKGGVTSLGSVLTKGVALIGKTNLALAGAGLAAYGLWKIYDRQKKEAERRDLLKPGNANLGLVGISTTGLGPSGPTTERTGTSPSQYAEAKKTYQADEGFIKLKEAIKGSKDQLAGLTTQYLSYNRAAEIENKGNPEAIADRKKTIDLLMAVLADELGIANEWNNTMSEADSAGASALDVSIEKMKAQKGEIEKLMGPGSTGQYAGLGLSDPFQFLRGDAVAEVGGVIASGMSAAQTNIAKTQSLMQDLITLGASGKASINADFATFKSDMPEEFQKIIGGATNLDEAVKNLVMRLGEVPEDVYVRFNGNPEKITAWLDALNQFDMGTDAIAKANTELVNAAPVIDTSGIEKAYDARIKGAEKAGKAAEKAHKAEQEASKARQDAITEEIDKKQDGIDAIQKEIDAINKKAEADKKALEIAKAQSDYEAERRKSSIDYYDALARGDYVGAAKTKSEMDQTDSNYQFSTANERIDAKAQKDADAKQQKIDAVQAEIDAMNKRIDAIGKVQEVSDKAFEKKQERDQEALAALQENKDAAVAAEKKKQEAAAAAQKKMRADALKTANEAIQHLDEVAKKEGITADEIRAGAHVSATAIGKALGWSAEKTKKYEQQMSTKLLEIYMNSMKGAGFEPRNKNLVQDAKGNWSVRPEFREPFKNPIADSRNKGRAHGGEFIGKNTAKQFTSGPLKSDETERVLQHGEFVVQKSAVKKYGANLLHDINKKKMHTGGEVGAPPAGLVASGVRDSQQSMLDGMMETAANQVAQMARTQPRIASISSMIPSDGLVGSTDVREGKRTGSIGSVAGAMKFLQGQMASGTNAWLHLCERLARSAYGLPGMYASAKTHFNAIPNAFRRGTSTGSAPAGALGFWNTGQWGHVAVSKGGGKYYTNLGDGTVGVLPASTINRWGPVMGVTEPWWGGNSMDIPGLRKGARIQMDNTLANLHRGETVLTAPLTDALSRGIKGLNRNPAIMGNTASVTKIIHDGEQHNHFHIQTHPGMDAMEIAEATFEVIQRESSRLGSK